MTFEEKKVVCAFVWDKRFLVSNQNIIEQFVRYIFVRIFKYNTEMNSKTQFCFEFFPVKSLKSLGFYS